MIRLKIKCLLYKDKYFQHHTMSYDRVSQIENQCVWAESDNHHQWIYLTENQFNMAMSGQCGINIYTCTVVL